MNKKMYLLTIAVVMSLLLVQAAFAVPFSDTVDFDFDGSGSIKIIDSYIYTHSLTGLNSTDYDLIDATLSLRHNGNSNNPGEVWFANSGANILIGQLSNSSGSTWTTDNWVLGSTILSEMESTTPWSLTVKLNDYSTGIDKIKLDWSTLSGNYNVISVNNPVPEPGTIMLLGSGLMCVAAFGRKRFKK